MNANLEPVDQVKHLEQASGNASIVALTVDDAREIMRPCSQSNFYERAKKHGWQKFKDTDGKVKYLIPQSDLDRYGTHGIPVVPIGIPKVEQLEQPNSNNGPTVPPTPQIDPWLEKHVEHLEQQLEEVKKEKQRLEEEKAEALKKIESKNSEIRRLEHDVITMNGKIESLQNPMVTVDHAQLLADALNNTLNDFKQTIREEMEQRFQTMQAPQNPPVDEPIHAELVDPVNPMEPVTEPVSTPVEQLEHPVEQVGKKPSWWQLRLKKFFIT